MGSGKMADNYQNEKYLSLLDNLGPAQSLVLIEKLTIDVKNTRRGLQAALSANAIDLLNEPSHVLVSLADVIGADELCLLARNISDYKKMGGADFPNDKVKTIVSQLDIWLDFLKADKIQRGQAI